MSYSLSGYFIEACDCTVICPCWVDDDPVGGHCTGLIAWQVTEGTIRDEPVKGCAVVSVSTHSGNRRQGKNTTTMLYVDDSASEKQFEVLVEAFAGRLGGTMGELAAVSGTVVGAERASIEISSSADDPKAPWRVTVAEPENADVRSVVAAGTPKIFDEDKYPGVASKPLTLRWTALSRELGVPLVDGESLEVTAQAGSHLSVNVGALPGGNIEVTERSGMRGHFRYQDAGDAVAQA